MKLSRTTTGLAFLVVLATLGAALCFVPPWLLEQYERVAKLGPGWVYAYFAVVGTGGAILLGCSGWVVWQLWSGTRRKARRVERRAKNPSELSGAERQREVAENLAAVADLKADAAVGADVKQELEPLVGRFEAKRDSQTLEIVAFGTISSGKSSLLNALAGRDVFQTEIKGGTTVRRNEVPWPGQDKVTLVDTPGLGEVDGAERAAISAAAAQDADLVLLVVDGPLRDSEFRLLEQLGPMEKRVLVCLNKEDWYDEQERTTLLDQLAGQVKEFVERADVVAVQSQAALRPRIRMLAGGGQSDEQVEVPPDIGPLADRMLQIVRRDGRDLLLANLLLQSRGLLTEARRRVREALDRRAWEIVDKYTWAAGGAAALSPLPVLDLVAGSAITTKMVVDLARVYRQEIALDVAVNLLGQLGKNLIAILGVTAITPAVTSGIASLLKTVPGAGTIAGGVLQGIVQAIVTRWIGAVFVEYFKHEMQQPPGGLAELAREQWQRVTSVHELRQLVQAARSRLMGSETERDERL